MDGICNNWFWQLLQTNFLVKSTGYKRIPLINGEIKSILTFLSTAVQRPFGGIFCGTVHKTCRT